MRFHLNGDLTCFMPERFMRQAAVSLSVSPPLSAKPFLKWAGGKTQLLADILARAPKRFGRYYEPFLGGGAVFFALKPERASLSDINPDLIEAYTAIRDHVEEVIAALGFYRCTKDDYYRVRAQKTDLMSLPQRAARLIYLNRTCFNGLYRVNRSGQFNVPFGQYKNPTICHADNLRQASVRLRHMRLRCQPVTAVARQARRGDFVYFDPPYVPLSPTAQFVHYARGGYGIDDQKRLAKLFSALSRRGVHVLLSNSDTPLVRELYRGFTIERVMARRNINRSAAGRGVVAEVLVSGGRA
jgi:DNA adenine methylase